MKLFRFFFLLVLISCAHHPTLNSSNKTYVGIEKLRKKKELKIIGWREWVALPNLKIPKIKVKVDTGARTSALHAFDIEKYRRDGKDFVKFKVHPEQDRPKKTIECRSRVLEYRKIKSSNGQTELRPVILTTVELLGEAWEVEITLTNRDQMGFRMLLGRASIKNKFLVHSGKSFYSKK